MDNVKLWFAKDDNDKVITINEINENNKDNTYSCPMCGSKLIPKAIKSKQVTSHFAHSDVSKCGESMIHWWFKNKFIEQGDRFSVVSDSEREYVCSEIKVEYPHVTEKGIYKPDVTIFTECGETIFFEMAFSNKKKIKDYLDIWLELNNVVVEVDIKSLMNNDTIPKFKALFYNGKCFNVKRNDTYYNTIGKYKEEKFKGDADNDLKDRIRKLDWFWDDIHKYRNGEINIDQLSASIESIDKEDENVVEKIFKKPSCINIMNDYMENILNKKYTKICKYIESKYGNEYEKYIHKKVEYVREPFIGSWYESKITIDDLKNEKVIVFNFSHYDKTEQVIKEIDLVFPKNKEVETYNHNVSMLQYTINNNDNYKRIIEELSLHDGYNFNIKVNKYRKNSTDTFMVLFDFKYKKRKISSCSFGKKIGIYDNVDEYIRKFEYNIEKYFNELKPLRKIEDLEVITLNLEQKFIEFELEVNGQLILENVYEISISGANGNSYLQEIYYIFEDCISMDIDKNIILSQVIDSQQVKDYIMKDIYDILQKETSGICLECDEEFTLELGEIKFFIQKGFDYPKRCKNCRKKKRLKK